MKKALSIALVMIAIAAAGYLLQYHLDKSELSPEPNGQLADGIIDFTLPDLDGNPRALSEWRGRALLVNFWATWCAPCRREIPLLKETQAMQADNKLQVIGIAVDYPEDVLAYAVDAQFNYPILIGQEDAMAAAEASGIEFIGMPFTLVVAADGQLIKAHIGEIVAEHIERIITVIAGLDSGELDLDAAKSALSDL
ncbi:MAG: TlpA family protein disulfide reductase [Gammaproteobacteria bacterium]|nr:TlpA family protein disulfide reductase [Gammaproteobacteria bacterium]MDH4315249.1 TlpA family protein disulfide reductase [Gammaproteobacteria bacterium]MDH5215536.1 TlpA family protein disulfide reductase [Gammaproteobacteria bacterium]